MSGCSEIVVAIKPYGFEKLLGGLDAQLKYHDPLIISIAAGKTIETISSYLSYEPALVRVMPNINATIGASMSAYCANGRVSAEQKAFVAKLCSSIGEAVELDEKFFSAFGVIGGAAPAFAYMFIDELARGGVKIGMNKQVALKVAAQTVLGSAKMIAESGEHPYALVDKSVRPAEPLSRALRRSMKTDLQRRYAGCDGNIRKGSETLRQIKCGEDEYINNCTEV